LGKPGALAGRFTGFAASRLRAVLLVAHIAPIGTKRLAAIQALALRAMGHGFPSLRPSWNARSAARSANTRLLDPKQNEEGRRRNYCEEVPNGPLDKLREEDKQRKSTTFTPPVSADFQNGADTRAWHQNFSLVLCLNDADDYIRLCDAVV
jgi:hypothetical protein